MLITLVFLYLNRFDLRGSSKLPQMPHESVMRIRFSGKVATPFIISYAALMFPSGSVYESKDSNN
jgi:hypothetical protein